MKKSKYLLALSLLFIGASSFNCSKEPSENPPGEIQALAHSPSVPVLKGLNVNLVLRIALSVPAGNAEQHFRKLRCTINPGAINIVDKIDVYTTTAETFTTGSSLTSFSPTATNFDIPVALNMNGGDGKFIWFSIVLKSSAAIDDIIELHCIKLVDDSNKELSVKEGGSLFVRRAGTAVRKAGDDAVNTYRIPGIVQTDKGTLIAVYDNRYLNSGDLPGNIDVGMSRSIDSGKTWQPMRVIMDMGAPHDNNGVGDPAILFDPLTKKIFVAALWSKGNRSIAGSLPGLSPDLTGQFVLVSSNDDGLTWTAPSTITPQVKNPAWHIFFNGPGSGIAMQDGKLVFAAQYWNETKMPFSTIIYSSDHGSTWIGKILGPKSNTTESQVVETIPGKLMLNMRDNRGSFRSVATTADMGLTWAEHSTSYNTLQDPICMASFIKARVNVNGTMKDVLFFSNPDTKSGRYNITIKASLDFGETWLPANRLLIDERQCYGYSSLTKINDNTIGILYEGTKDLYFVKVPVMDIIN